MTRGKNANRAANREQVMADRQAPLRRRIAQLEAEVTKLECANLEQQAMHIEVTNRLRAQIAANTGERLEEALLDVTKARQLLETTETARKVIAGGFHRLGAALQEAYEQQGMKVIDARERTLKVARIMPSHINDEIPGFIKVEDLNTTAGASYGSGRDNGNSGRLAVTTDPDEIARMHRLQRAKGLRA